LGPRPASPAKNCVFEYNYAKMSEKGFSSNIEEVVLPFPRAMYIPSRGDVIIFREGVNLKVCHSKEPDNCFDCIQVDCKFAGEAGKDLMEFWNQLENIG